MEADLLITSMTNLLEVDLEGVSCLLVDEAQFLPPEIVDQLREISFAKDVPVICYGLRTDFHTHLFPGSRRLMELADSIEEVKATCFYCNRKSILNLKHIDGKATLDGPTIHLGSEEKYYPTCYKCYREQLKNVGVDQISEVAILSR